MGVKIHDYSPNPSDGVHLYAFHCPGCKYDHAFRVGAVDGRPSWQFNGSPEQPTFTPSLLCNKDIPESGCHSFVTDGRIKFLTNSFHILKGQTVDLPDWEGW